MKSEVDSFGLSRQHDSERYHSGDDIFGSAPVHYDPESSVMQFIRATAYTAIQEPINGLTQLVNHTAGTKLEPIELVFSPLEDNLWTKGGAFCGTLFDVAIASRIAGSAVSKVGLAKGALAPMLTGGLGGAMYGVMLPVDEPGGYFDATQNANYWQLKGRNVAVLAGTFATMAGASQLLGSAGFLGEAGKRTLLQDVALGGLSGAPAGAVNAELSSLLDGKGLASAGDLVSNTLNYGAFGAAMGGLNHGLDSAAKSVNKMFSNNYFDDSGRLTKVKDPWGDSAYLKYDESGQLNEFRKTGPDGLKEIYRAVKGADGKVSWTVEGRLDFEKVVPLQPAPVQISVDADGKGLVFNSEVQTVHMRSDSAGTVTSTPEQKASQAKFQPEWDKFIREFRGTEGPRPLGGAGLMIPRI